MTLRDEVDLSVDALKTGLGVDDVDHLTTLENHTVDFECEVNPGVAVNLDVADLLDCVLIFHTISILELRRNFKGNFVWIPIAGSCLSL